MWAYFVMCHSTMLNNRRHLAAPSSICTTVQDRRSFRPDAQNRRRLPDAPPLRQFPLPCSVPLTVYRPDLVSVEATLGRYGANREPFVVSGGIGGRLVERVPSLCSTALFQCSWCPIRSKRPAALVHWLLEACTSTGLHILACSGLEQGPT